LVIANALLAMLSGHTLQSVYDLRPDIAKQHAEIGNDLIDKSIQTIHKIKKLYPAVYDEFQKKIDEM
jgi:hypothetical protein